MTVHQRLSIAVLFSLLVASPSLAKGPNSPDYGRSGWYAGMGAGAGWDFIEDWVEDEIDAACGVDDCVDLTSGGTFNIRGGYRVNSWFATEIMYEGVYGITAETGTALTVPPTIPIPKGTKLASFDLHNFLWNIKFIAPIKRVQPYFLLGLGAQYHTFKAKGFGITTTSRTDFVIRPALGLDLYLTENWLFNTELAVGLSLRKYKNIPTATTDNLTMTLSFGATYRF